MAIASGAISLGIAALALSAHQTLKFDSTPGEQVAAPDTWPRVSHLMLSAERPTFLIFAHPYCSCTSATFSELAAVLADLKRSHLSLPAIYVLFAPTAGGEHGEAARHWDEAASLSGAQVLWDDSNREAKLFGARTSGFTLLYGSSGALLFHGGVTGSRGHAGINIGSERLVDAIRTLRPSRDHSFVFGCSIFGSDHEREER